MTRRRPAALLLAGGMAAALLLGASEGRVGWTEARWTDPEHARSAVSSATLGAPTAIECQQLLAGVTLRWSLPSTGPTPDGYRISAWRDGTQVTAEYTVNEPTREFTVTTLLGELLGSTTYQVRIVSARAAWRSPAATQNVRTNALGLVPQCVG